MKIQIRHPFPSDMPILDKLEKISFSDFFSRELLETLAFSKFGEFLVAEADGLIAGYVSAVFEGDFASITSIAVHPDYKRKQIARKLILQLLETLRKKRIFDLKLEVRESNVAAKQLYDALGFKTSHVKHRYYDDGEKAIIMCLTLKK